MTQNTNDRRGTTAEAAPVPAALGPPLLSRQDSRRWGRSLRRGVSRRAHADWSPSPLRADPVEVLVESNRARDQQLVPLRYGRMLASPFAFFRGAALLFALDLAEHESTGLRVQLCGDAHLLNFGLFASPERRLVFDLNDFDETWPGPFEWDLKRLATSGYIAALDARMSRRDARHTATMAVRSYQKWIRRYSQLSYLEIFYERIGSKALLTALEDPKGPDPSALFRRARRKDHERALSKLTTTGPKGWRIVPNPPVVTRYDHDTTVAKQLPLMVESYRSTLPDEIKAMFDRYRLVDFARKVVGVGSVGTLCWVLLMVGPHGGPLFLQAKQALPAAPQIAGLPGEDLGHHGRRVVAGQRRLQADSDILLGWTTATDSGNHYYVRQLWDAKGSVDPSTMTPSVLANYMALCGKVLARAHARTGGPASIAGYLGCSDAFERTIVDFAAAYSAQNKTDHARLAKAASNGLVPVMVA